MSTLLGNLRVGVDYATFEARRQARLIAAQTKLRKLRTQERDQFLHLGEETLALFTAAEPLDQRLQRLCQELLAVMQQIEQQEYQIVEIKQEQPPEPITCPQCGREVGEQDAFCAGCGTKFVQTTPVQSTPAAQTLCPNCGREIRDNAKFCSTCGHRMAAQ